MNHEKAEKLIEDFEFDTLFAEQLFWNRLPTTVTLEADGQTFVLVGIAEKSGVQIFLCPPMEDGLLPPYALRQKIERELTRQAREHLIIFVDAKKSTQIWQWVARAPGKPNSTREIEWRRGTSTEVLLEKLHLIAFRLDDDTVMTVLDVAGKLQNAFEREKVSRDFYKGFDLVRGAFEAFIKGIPGDSQSWYTSVMINRLMFVYFLQRKPLPDGQFFLDNRYDYLRHHLTQSKAQGKDQFYSGFLCPLFFHGFAQADNRNDVFARFGDIPYLNGGLFARHKLEEEHGDKIAIPDSAFEKLFDFFDEWDWHLDERPLADKKAKEINPDALGYIFEKYINQKQMGAYYTKEDITGYICRNTIVPFLLQSMQQRCGKAFADAAWPLLSADPDRYIWPAMQKGVQEPLPAEIEIGCDTTQPDLIARRKNWNRSAPASHALPTEIWRETIARRERYAEVHGKLARGEVSDINDLITLNLDICQFAQDIVERSEDPAIVRALWRALVGVVPGANESQRAFEHGISVLDPTCGSGAFLFAALNILEPLYQACLQRMRAFVLQADIDGESKLYPDFRTTLADVDARPNERYFIFKSIVVNNLYGVDIMDEAVEIAKLRLFLKLVAQLNDKRHIEPLPDIDFNIRAGNALVGFASYEEVKAAVTHSDGGQAKMLFDDAMTLIEQDAHVADAAFRRFRQQQVRLGQDIDPAAKEDLKNRLTDLEGRLNWYLAREYGVDPTQTKKFEHWRSSHKPFHWFVDFYGIMQGGGFDVIVGNPPYVEYSKVRDDYSLMPTMQKDLGNLFAYVMLRSIEMLKPSGYQGLIVPVSIVSTQRMKVVQSKLLEQSSNAWFSNYGERPSRLFSGAEVLLTISLLRKTGNKPANAVTHVTGLRKWGAVFREKECLFETTAYTNTQGRLRGFVIPKFTENIELGITSKLFSSTNHFGASFRRQTKHKLFYRIGGGRYWKVFTSFQPLFILNGMASVSSRENYIYFDTEDERDLAIAVLSSSLFFWFFSISTNGRDLNPIDLTEFPIDINRIEAKSRAKLISLSQELMVDYRRYKKVKHKESKKTGAIQFEEFYPRESKNIIDRIDQEIAHFLELRVQELDFIINYDIKYRLGAEAADD